MHNASHVLSSLFTTFWDLDVLLVHRLTSLFALGRAHLLVRLHHLVSGHHLLLLLVSFRRLHLTRFLHLRSHLVGLIVLHAVLLHVVLLHVVLLVIHSNNTSIGAVAAATTDSQFALYEFLTDCGTRLTTGGIVANLIQGLAECRFFDRFVAHAREKGCRAAFKILGEARFKCRLRAQAFRRNANTVVIIIASCVGRIDNHDGRWRRDWTRHGRWKELLATGITCVLFEETTLKGTNQFPACGAAHGNTTEIVSLGTESHAVFGDVVELALGARQTASTLGLSTARHQVVILVGASGQLIDSNDAWLWDRNKREQHAVARH